MILEGEVEKREGGEGKKILGDDGRRCDSRGRRGRAEDMSVEERIEYGIREEEGTIYTSRRGRRRRDERGTEEG